MSAASKWRVPEDWPNANKRDEGRMYLEYSVIESTPPLPSHVTSIALQAHEEGTLFTWQTHVEPVEVEPFIAKGRRQFRTVGQHIG